VTVVNPAEILWTAAGRILNDQVSDGVWMAYFADTSGLCERPTNLNSEVHVRAFVTGPSNRFAQAAALSVAETPARSYNPLFVYGDAGLGKTHLLQAIAHYVNENYPSYRVRYISTETLLNEFVDAIRNNTPGRVQAALPRDRRAPRRRHPVHGGQGTAPGGVLPHLQHAARGQPADRAQLRPPARRDRHPRGPPPQPLQDGSDHRHPAAGLRDPAGHPPQEGGAGQHADPIRGARVHRQNVTNNIRELEGALNRVTAYASAQPAPTSPST
jgi:hypothetical protein